MGIFVLKYFMIKTNNLRINLQISSKIINLHQPCDPTIVPPEEIKT